VNTSDYGLVLPANHELGEENVDVDVYLRGSNNVIIDLSDSCRPGNILVEGELETLLQQTSRVFYFTLSPAIMRLLEILCKDSRCADLREHALAFMMLTHGRLGKASVLRDLCAQVLELVVRKAMARPWGIFRRDVTFVDFLGLVAQHINTTIRRQELHQVVLSKHSRERRRISHFLSFFFWF